MDLPLLRIRMHRRPRAFRQLNLFWVVLACLGLMLRNRSPKPPPASRIAIRMQRTGDPFLKAFRDEVRSYTLWHNNITNLELSDSARTLCFDPSGRAGLGDKFRGIHFSFLAAMETRRYFVIQPVSLLPLQVAFTPRIRWDRLPTNGFSNVKSIRIRLGQKLPPAVLGKQRFVRVRTASFPTYYSIGHVGSRKYLDNENIEMNRIVFHSLFAVNKEIRDAALNATISTKGFDVIHARVGGEFRREKTTDRFRHFNEDPVGTSQRLLDCLELTRKDPASTKRTVYVASDDSRFRKLLADKLKQRQYRVIESLSIVKHTGLIRPKEAATVFKATLTEAYIFGSARHLVTTGSGLANLAIFMGNASLREIYRCPGMKLT